MAITVRSQRVALVLGLLCITGPHLAGQTVLKLPKNKFTPQQDVETKTTSSGQQVIVIEPANPQVVYVPQYNPQVVYTQPTSSTVVGRGSPGVSQNSSITTT